MLYKIGRAFCVLLTRILFKVELVGRENIPAEGSYIIAANHRTNFDPMFVVRGIKPQVFFMAKMELFQKSRFLGWFLRGAGAFPVERGRGDTGAIDWAQQVVRQGGVLGMFPEGTRSKSGAPGRPKSGVAMIAYQTGADVLPCAICYGEELRFRTRVTLRYGAVIKNAALGFSGGELAPREMKVASHRIMDQIIALMGGVG